MNHKHKVSKGAKDNCFLKNVTDAHADDSILIFNLIKHHMSKSFSGPEVETFVECSLRKLHELLQTRRRLQEEYERDNDVAQLERQLKIDQFYFRVKKEIEDDLA